MTPTEKRLELFDRVKARIRKGETTKDACIAEGRTYGWYHTMAKRKMIYRRKINSMQLANAKRRYTKKPQAQTFILPDSKDSIIFLKCSPQQLEALKAVVNG